MENLDVRVARLVGWLETLHGAGGYGGPVAHWWQQSLLYTGPGLDWRYEGIIIGYLQLWQRTGQNLWLKRAQQAGDDLVGGQLENGHYRASAFEINPATGGTPHEGACDNGLLALAATLRGLGWPEWERYLAAARLNLQAYYVDRLWDDKACFFRDSPTTASFVPNKAATACDALFRLAELTGEAVWAEHYALPTLDRVLEHQVKGDNPLLEGAIAQNSFGSHKIQKYFPIYNARCVSALLKAYNWTSHEKYLTAAQAVMAFITRWVREDGSLPTVVYSNGQTNLYPSWLAALGDVLRAADELRPYGFDTDLQLTEAYMLGGQDRSGGIGTASGFAAQAGHKPSTSPDVRDLLHVAGWCDKAFRYLSNRVSGEALPAISSECFEAECVFQNQALLLIETADKLEIRQPGRGKTVYYWQKGQTRPRLAEPSFWLR